MLDGPPPLDDTISDAEWLAAFDVFAEQDGTFQTLDDEHSAAFVDNGGTLLVSFESTASIRNRFDARPLGLSVANGQNWSSLTLLTTEATWWRAAPVYGYFDRLIDDGFFEDFDQVVFQGAGMAGYGAAAFSVAAPGATVVLTCPQATLNPAITPWEGRFRAYRGADFSSRFGYAPDMIQGAGAVFVLYDPLYAPDAMHAALFHDPVTQMIPLRHFGAEAPQMLDRLGVTETALRAAGQGMLSPEIIYRAARARHRHTGWLDNLLTAAKKRGGTGLVQRLCHTVLARYDNPNFRKALDQIDAPTD